MQSPHTQSTIVEIPKVDSASPEEAVGVPRPQVKLPKLELKKFDGDVSKWHPFWDTFQSSIHNNPSLAEIGKFNYLNSLLLGTASDAISGLSLTAANYEEAITILKRRFGNK